MIKKACLTAISLFALYSLFLLITGNIWSPAQYLYQENIIKAEKYLYEKSEPKAVILGTSLSARIITDSLPGFYNLSMPGMSMFDGLHILLKRKTLPAAVFIEINYFYKPEKEDFIRLFDNTAINYLKLKLPALRDENQPLGISFEIIHRVARHQSPKKTINTTSPVDTALFQLVLNRQVKTYLSPDRKLIDSSTVVLKKAIEEITQRGSKVYFFEMPVNPALTSLLLANKVRAAVAKNFPKFTFIPLPGEKFVTVDGVHLGESEALKYTLYLKRKIGQLPSL